MNNPVANYLSERARQRVIVILILFNTAIIVAMEDVSSAFRPYTIVDFELAGSVERARQILDIWQDNGAMSSLFFVLGFDYLFMLVYSVSLWFVCLHVANVIQGLTRFMILLAWLQPVAALFDAIENVALFQVASGSLNASWPALSWWSAVPKFMIVLTGLTFWLALAGTNLYRRLMKQP